MTTMSVSMSMISSTSAFLEPPEGSGYFKSKNTRTRTTKASSTSTPTSTSARITPKEEKELLRRAVEYRRIVQLEKDLALQHHNFLPPLSFRAKSAGYGERFEDYEDAKYEGQIARETMVTQNMGLVRYCLNQIIGKETALESNSGSNKGLPLNSLSREDLTQEGAIGLARAVDKWDPEIGGKFSTYAVYWVRAAVLRSIAERDDVVRVPSHVSQAIVSINKAAKRLGWVLQESGGILVTENGDRGSKSVLLDANTADADDNDNDNDNNHKSTSPRWRAANAARRLAEEAGLSERHFEEAMRARRRRYSGGYVAVESWMQKTKTNGNHYQHHQSDENEDHDRKRMESSVANEDIRTALSKHLRPKEMEALSWRYGLYEDEDHQEEQQPQNVAAQSIQERANRQFMEMEDQLFGPSAVTAAAVSSTSSSTSTVAQTPMMARPAKIASTPKKQKAAAAPVKPGRFGEAMTFTEVGKKMQVSAEYTRRLCHKALNKLQQAAEDGTLEPVFLY